MRDLSKLLWAELQSDEERIEFLDSGRAVDTGIIAPVMVDEIARAFRYKLECLTYLGELRAKTDYKSRVFRYKLECLNYLRGLRAKMCHKMCHKMCYKSREN